jgi:hypothetical protein
MGAKDIRWNTEGRTDFRLARQLRAYNKGDDPPARVKPVPIQVVAAVVNAAYNSTTATESTKAVADMIVLAFFYLLRPGEYTYATDNTPFRLGDVKLYIGSSLLQYATATPADFHAVTSVSLKFTSQKNGVKGEVISHGLSGDPLNCPVKAAVRRVQYLRNCHAPSDTPLCTYYTATMRRSTIKSPDIKDALRKGLMIVGPDSLDILPTELESRSLRAGGATALLCANIDFNTIRLLGRWKSDAMIRYLHISANPAVHKLAKDMYAGGFYSFVPGTTVPQQ